MKIKSMHPSQGDYVVINDSDFDAKIHTKYEEDLEPEAKEEKPKRKPKAEKGV